MNDFHRSYIDERLNGADSDEHHAQTGTARIAVIGAGMAGLTAAHHLSRRGLDVTVFETNDRPGGCLRTDHVSGYVLERGPHTLRAGNLAFEGLVNDLGLSSHIQPAPEAAARRYIVKHSRLLPLPVSLSAFMTTPLFSKDAKLQLLAEPLRGGGPDDDIDESLAQFIERRLGEEFLDYAVGPFVGGIHAADPRLLSSRHALSGLYDLENDWGSIAIGGLARLVTRLLDGGPSPSGDLFGFRGGNQLMADRLAERLGDRIHFKTPIRYLERGNDGWTLRTDSGENRGQFDDVILTAPTHSWPEFKFEDPELGNELTAIAEEIDYPPLAVVQLAYDRNCIHHPLDGFGMLVPDEEAYRMLGTLFISTLFPDRTPANKVLLSSFVGGSRDRSLTKLSDEQLIDVVDSDLAELLGVRESPDYADVFRWPNAIPQYEVGYGRLLKKMSDVEHRWPGLHLTGNFRDGVGVPDVVESATELADDLAELHTSTEYNHFHATCIS